MNGYAREHLAYFREHNQPSSRASSPKRGCRPRRCAARVTDQQTVDGTFVDGTYFLVLGLKPAIGRLIGPNDDRPGAASAVAVISWQWWRNRFESRPIRSRQPDRGFENLLAAVLPVVGVAPRGFVGFQPWLPEDAWMPLAMQPVVHHPRNAQDQPPLILVARLKPDVTIHRARSEMTVLFHQLGHDEIRTSDNVLRKIEFFLEPAGSGLSQLRDLYAKPLVVLMAVVGLLLLIACTNLAAMLLARGAARQRETRAAGVAGEQAGSAWGARC